MQIAKYKNHVYRFTVYGGMRSAVVVPGAVLAKLYDLYDRLEQRQGC